MQPKRTQSGVDSKEALLSTTENPSPEVDDTKLKEAVLETEEDISVMTKHFLQLAIPAIFNSVFAMLITQVNIVFVGQMG